MKSEYTIFFLLIGFSIINTVIHFTHPAYKYYKQNIAKVESKLLDRQDKFEKKIIGDLLPAIYQSISNSYLVVNGSAPSVSAPIQAKSDSRTVKQLDASFYIFRGVPCFEYNGITFQVGDNFDGSAITSVSPLMIRTGLADYEIRRQSRSFASERSISYEAN